MENFLCRSWILSCQCSVTGWKTHMANVKSERHFAFRTNRQNVLFFFLHFYEIKLSSWSTAGKFSGVCHYGNLEITKLTNIRNTSLDELLLLLLFQHQSIVVLSVLTPWGQIKWLDSWNVPSHLWCNSLVESLSSGHLFILWKLLHS